MDHPPAGPKDKGGNRCSEGWAPRRMSTSGRHLFRLALSPQPPRMADLAPHRGPAVTVGDVSQGTAMRRLEPPS